MKYYDVHCHLDLCKDVPGIIESCLNEGVEILTAGVNLETNRKCLELSERHKNVHACLGLYPIDALSYSDKEIDEEIEFIRKNAKKIKGIGEVGIDLKESADFEKQKKTFVKMIELANELNKPLIVHSRKAELQCIEILEKMKTRKVVMHCFFGKASLYDRIVKNNWFLSIPANVKGNKQLQEMVDKVPISNLLCETDAPFLHPDRKNDNSSDKVVESYFKIAEIKKIGIDECKKKIEENYKKIF